MHDTRGAADATTGTGVSAALLLIADSRLPAGGHAHSGGAEEAVHVGAITGPEDLARFLRGRLATTGLVTAALSAAACHLASVIRHEAESRRDPALVADASPPDESDARSKARVLSPRRAGKPTPVTEQQGLTTPVREADIGVGTSRTLPRPHSRSTPPGDRAGQGSAGLWRELDAEADVRTPSPAMRTASRTQGRLLVRSARRIWPSAVLDELAKALPEGAHHAVALGAVAYAAGCSPREAALAAAYNAITGPATAVVRLLGLDPVTVHRLLADLSPELDGTATAAVTALNDTHVDETGISPEPTAALDLTSTPGHAMSTDATAPVDIDQDAWRGDASSGSVLDGASRDRTIRYDWAALPSCGAPALDLLAEGHLRREVRLFVS